MSDTNKNRIEFGICFVIFIVLKTFGMQMKLKSAKEMNRTHYLC